MSGLEEAKISLSRINYNCGRFEKVFNSEDDLSNNENNDYPLMCHICFNFSKDKDSKLKHLVENNFKIPGTLQAYVGPRGLQKTVIVIDKLVCILLLHPNPNILLLKKIQ